MSKPSKPAERKPTAFEAFVSAILAVPKDAIKNVEGKRLKRASRKRDKANS